MPLHAWLRSQGYSGFDSLDSLRVALAKRDASALQALGAALESPDLAELASGDGAPLCASIARDLRNQRTPRTAALLAALKSEVPSALLGKLFAGAGDLLTDGRLGDYAKRLVDVGLPAALADPECAAVGAVAGAFARSAREARLAFGQGKVAGPLAAAPKSHAGAAAARLAAFGEALPPEQVAQWKAWLVKQCTTNRKAPPSARRAGLVPPWPPDLPDAFADLVKEVEAAIPASGELPPKAAAPAPAISPPAKLDAPSSEKPKPGVGAPIKPRPQRPPQVPPEQATPPPPPAPPPPKWMSPIPRPRGIVMEGAAARGKSQALPVEPPPSGGPKMQPAIASRHVPEKAAPDRRPVIPPPPPFKAQNAVPPFLERARALCAGELDAIERLCATADVRAAIVGEDRALAELRRDAAPAAPAPDATLARLTALAEDAAAAPIWRKAAAVAHDVLAPRADAK